MVQVARAGRWQRPSTTSLQPTHHHPSPSWWAGLGGPAGKGSHVPVTWGCRSDASHLPGVIRSPVRCGHALPGRWSLVLPWRRRPLPTGPSTPFILCSDPGLLRWPQCSSAGSTPPPSPAEGEVTMTWTEGTLASGQALPSSGPAHPRPQPSWLVSGEGGRLALLDHVCKRLVHCTECFQRASLGFNYDLLVAFLFELVYFLC